MEKISPFEFAIMQIADPDKAKKYKAFTQEEIQKQREDKIKMIVRNIKLKNNE